MLFPIDDDRLDYRDGFDEFPGRRAHAFEFTLCACGHEAGRLVATTTRHRNFLPVMACARCGTLRANPYFTRETAGHYYAHVYGPVKRQGMTPEKLQARQRGDSLAPFLAPHLDGVGSVLDFGGGAGGRTIELIAPGRTVALHEVEGDYSAAAYRAGLARHEEGTRYDLVVVSHVIEHLLDPRAEIGEVIERHCTPGGLILVATPLIDHHPSHKWLRLFHFAHKYYFGSEALTGFMAELGAELVAKDGVETFLFRLGRQPDEGFAAACYARGAATTARAIRAAELRLPLRRLRRRLGRGAPAPRPVF